MRRILAFALLAAFALAASVPVSLLTAGKAAARTVSDVKQGGSSPSRAARRGRQGQAGTGRLAITAISASRPFSEAGPAPGAQEPL